MENKVQSKDVPASLDLIRTIKAARLQCKGLLQRMGNTEITRRFTNSKLEGSRTVGRPKVGWMVTRDTQSWKWVLQEAEAQCGL
jgi:hypothetical protein